MLRKKRLSKRKAEKLLEKILPIALKKYAIEHPEYMEQLNRKIESSNLDRKILWDTEKHCTYLVK